MDPDPTPTSTRVPTHLLFLSAPQVTTYADNIMHDRRATQKPEQEGATCCCLPIQKRAGKPESYLLDSRMKIIRWENLLDRQSRGPAPTTHLCQPVSIGPVMRR